MTFKTIFVPLAIEPTAKAVVDSALVMAHASKGHVMAHHVRQRFTGYPPIEFYPADGTATAMALEAHDEATAAFARTMCAIFEERCDNDGAHIVPVSEALKHNGVTASWTEETGPPLQGYSLTARIADLVVMAIPARTDVHLEREIFEDTLMRSGAPVLLVPRTGLAAAPRRPLIAWDGSLQASRVVRETLPLLRESEETTLLTIGETDPGTSTEDLRAGGRAAASSNHSSTTRIRE